MDDARFLRGVVTSKTGVRQEISTNEINIMDEAWNASAKRYTGGKILVANLPGVDIGSTIEVELEVTSHSKPYIAGYRRIVNIFKKESPRFYFDWCPNIGMGELDPDFKDPAAEADWIGATLHGEVVMVPEAGHYPQGQQPDVTSDAVERFLGSVHRA